MVRFIVLRHGFSQGNREKLFTGQIDLPLDEEGVSQACSIAAFLLKNYQIDCIYSSDLCRAVDTVKPLAKALGLPIYTSTLLRETNEGIWQGMRVEDVKTAYSQEFARYKENPGRFHFLNGECYTDVMLRGKRILQEIAEENEGKTVVIATHGGWIRAMRMYWQQLSADQIGALSRIPNGSVTVVEYHGDHITLPCIGSTDHLVSKDTEADI